MQRTRFGRTGVPVSRLCLGTATFGKQTDEAESHRILDAAADSGINFLDTADFYPMGAAQAQLGGTEEITGRWRRLIGCSPSPSAFATWASVSQVPQ
jgi:aryl-alcohol dehydrogenase-like predicted oxidoreductase